MFTGWTQNGRGTPEQGGDAPGTLKRGEVLSFAAAVDACIKRRGLGLSKKISFGKVTNEKPTGVHKEQD